MRRQAPREIEHAPGQRFPLTIHFTMSLSTSSDLIQLPDVLLPTRETVLQEGDMLHLVMREEHAAHAYAVLEAGPEAD